MAPRVAGPVGGAPTISTEGFQVPVTQGISIYILLLIQVAYIFHQLNVYFGLKFKRMRKVVIDFDFI